MGGPRFEYSFAGETLRAFPEAFFEEYDVGDMLIAETEASTDGWASGPAELPGENYAKNPEGEQTRPYARVTIDSRSNEHLDGLDTELAGGDRIALSNPFIYCC